MIKVVVFDLEGTVLDSFPILLKCVNDLADEFEYNKLKDTPEFRCRSMRKVIKNDLDIPLHNLSAYADKIKALVHHRIKDAKMFRGMKSLLKKLSSNYTIGLISFNTKELIQHVVKKNSIEGVSLVLSESPLFDKHKVLKHLMREQKLKSEEVIFVGDEVEDVKECKDIGVKMIAVAWGCNSKKALEKEGPAYLVDKPEEIIDILMPSD